MSPSDLEARIDNAFSKGNNQTGLQLLRELANTGPVVAAVFHRLAVVEEQIGDRAAATQAHLKCLKHDSWNPLAYLYAAYWLEQTGQLEHALAIYSLGLDLIESAAEPEALAQQSGETQKRYRAAQQALRVHFSSLHQRSVGSSAECRRIKNAIWVRTHLHAFEFQNDRQRPHLFYIPNLANSFEASAHVWLTELEQRSNEIADEFNKALPTIIDGGRPYLAAETSDNAGFGSLPGSLNWTALDLFKNGKEHKAISCFFPKTLSMLESVPLYGLYEQPFEVFFSLLKAGQRINPHYGLSNHSLTVHLPIEVPENCHLTVDGNQLRWQQGKALIFDDTLLHAAENNSDKQRIVLIFSIWNPQLSEEERSAIQRTFQARSEWLDKRTIVEPLP
ncbi:MAG: aspartyl/asparaginyl beta-hydroxylase domain-containing protein [Pseudomonadales bacterium]